MAGKGSKLRKGANLDAYYNNYDAIFKPKIEPLTSSEIEELEDCKNSMSHSEFLKISKRHENESKKI